MIEVLKQALEAMQYADACLKKQLTTKTKHEYAQDLLMEAGTALRQAIAELESQEPVIDKSAAKRIATSLGWSPQRKWVGLTDEERQDCLKGLPTQTIDVYARRIEAKLKEKNT